MTSQTAAASACATLVLVAGLAGCDSRSQPDATRAGTAAQTAASQVVAAAEPRCATSCSPDKPRTAVAEISWPMTDRAASREALTERVSQQALDVTTFKDGFATGAFAQLGGVREAARFASRAAPQDVTAAAAFEGLTVTRVTTLDERISSGASRTAPELMPTSVTDPARVVVVEIEGLEPGLNYYWRRSAGGPVVRCQAPICPFDGRRR